MIQLRIEELCKERGIKHPFTALKKAGIPGPTAILYLHHKKKTLVLDHTEKLCRLFRCAPNELFEWTPDNKAEDYPENPLQTIRKKATFDLEEKLKGMSVEEIKRRLGE